MTRFRRRDLIKQEASVAPLISQISNVTGEDATISSFGTKKGVGSTGVSFRYHKPNDYHLLSGEQKNELREWRQSTNKSKGGKGKEKGKQAPKKKKSNSAKATAAAVEKKVEARVAAIEKEKTDEVQTGACFPFPFPFPPFDLLVDCLHSRSSFFCSADNA
jgi:hypothetical protein